MGECLGFIFILILLAISIFGIGYYYALLKIGKIMRKDLDEAELYSDEFQMGMFKIINDIIDNT